MLPHCCHSNCLLMVYLWGKKQALHFGEGGGEALIAAAAVVVATKLLIGWSMACELSGGDRGFFEAQNELMAFPGQDNTNLVL